MSKVIKTPQRVNTAAHGPATVEKIYTDRHTGEKVAYVRPDSGQPFDVSLSYAIKLTNSAST